MSERDRHHKGFRPAITIVKEIESILDDAEMGCGVPSSRLRDCVAELRELNERVPNRPIEELIAQYEEENCDHSDLEWVVDVSKRYVSTMQDSQVRCLLHTLANAGVFNPETHVAITKGNKGYNEGYHYVTQTYIGLAKMALMSGEADTAWKYLQQCSVEIDKVTEANLPAIWEMMQEFKDRRENTD